MDPDDYLQDDFDPSSVTVPRLRSILVTHNIAYPSTAKKPQLVEIFNEELVPKAHKILAQRARAKRSSMGIVDAASSFDAPDLEPPEDLPPPRAPVARPRSPRKTSSNTRLKEEFRSAGADEQLNSFDNSTNSNRQSIMAGKHLLPAFNSETNNYDDTPRRKSRRSITPNVKSEEPEPQIATHDTLPKTAKPSETGFSNENPFQSGSSPPPAIKNSARRRTTGNELFRSPPPPAPVTAAPATINRYPSEQRRRTADTAPLAPVRAPAPRIVSATSNTFHIPLNNMVAHQSVDFDDIDNNDDVEQPGEEFTPEEQLELAQEMADKGEVTMVRRQRQAHQIAPRRSLQTPLTVLFVTLLGAYMAWYRQEKVAVGYCGLGRNAHSLVSRDIPIPEWAVPLVEPQCEPCPPHAYCYENWDCRCETDYILKPHPFSLGGLVPLAPTCEPDDHKLRKVNVVATKVVDELRERRAKFECGELLDEEGNKENSPAIEENKLKETISRQKSRKLSAQEFDDLWAAALGEVKGRDEVEVVQEQQTQDADSPDLPNTYLSSTSLARIRFTCAVRRSILHSLARYRLPAGLLALAGVAFLYVRSRYRSHVATNAQIPALVSTVLERLSAQKDLAIDDEENEDPWLFLPNLRDDVLRSIHSLAERERIWQRVRAVVEMNSNVRTSQREGRSTGEVGRAWEWVGSLGSDALRRRSGRISFGPDGPRSSLGGGAAAEEPEVKREKTSRGAWWENNRPKY